MLETLTACPTLNFHISSGGDSNQWPLYSPTSSIQLTLLRSEAMFFVFVVFKVCVLCVYVSLCIHVFRCLQRPGEGSGFPRAEITGSCEWPNMGTGTEPRSREISWL